MTAWDPVQLQPYRVERELRMRPRKITYRRPPQSTIALDLLATLAVILIGILTIACWLIGLVSLMWFAGEVLKRWLG